MPPLPPKLKAELLLGLAAGRTPEELRGAHGISPREWAAILREAAGYFAGDSHSTPTKTNDMPTKGLFIVHIDGASRGNPGHASAGIVIHDDGGTLIHEEGRYLGVATNNEAEYRALLLALERTRELGGAELSVLADSELLVKQIDGRYRVREPRLQELHRQATVAIGTLRHFAIRHVPREQNRLADAMANKALDAYTQRRNGNG